MSANIVGGNLLNYALDGRFDVIVHGANCQNRMGSGIAKQIKQRFPQAYRADTHAASEGKNVLGNISHARIIDGDADFFLVNAYTQDQYGYDGEKYASYDAVDECFQKINRMFPTGHRIGYPAIGCGLGGLEWDIVSRIIRHRLKRQDHTLVVYSQDMKLGGGLVA